MSTSSSESIAYQYGPAGVEVRIQREVYDLDTIAAAAHRFTDRAYVDLSHDGDSRTICRLRPKSSLENLERLAGEFANELLDQKLRARLAEQTEPIRRLLIAQAFSRTNLLHPELDDDSSGRASRSP